MAKKSGVSNISIQPLPYQRNISSIEVQTGNYKKQSHPHAEMSPPDGVVQSINNQIYYNINYNQYKDGGSFLVNDDQRFQSVYREKIGPVSQQLNHSQSQMQFLNRKNSHFGSRGSFEKEQEQSFTQNIMQTEFAAKVNTQKGSSNQSQSRRSRDSGNQFSNRKYSNGSGSGSRGMVSVSGAMNNGHYPKGDSNHGSFNSNNMHYVQN